jgi:hypothetical protein
MCEVVERLTRVLSAFRFPTEVLLRWSVQNLNLEWFHEKSIACRYCAVVDGVHYRARGGPLGNDPPGAGYWPCAQWLSPY